MPINYPPESPFRIENEKWNKPYVFRMYPKMLYRAKEHNGKFVTAIPNDDAFAASCQYEAQNEYDEREKLNQGWSVSPTEAIARELDRVREISDATAARHYVDSKMSEKAQAEAKKHDDSTEHQLPEIPVARRTRADK